jgi:hypothetical protein
MRVRDQHAAAQMWIVVICSCIVQLLVAANWVGFI